MLCTTLKGSDAFVTHNQMIHDQLQGALPLARGPRARTTVRTVFAGILVIGLFGVHQRHVAAARRILARKHDIAGHFLHREITNVTYN